MAVQVAKAPKVRRAYKVFLEAMEATGRMAQQAPKVSKGTRVRLAFRVSKASREAKAKPG
jgi:hypothetical protein